MKKENCLVKRPPLEVQTAKVALEQRSPSDIQATSGRD